MPGPGGPSGWPFFRGRGRDFSERDRALLALLRPHLHRAYLTAERRRNPAPQLTPRQTGLLHLVAAGHTNAQIGRRLGISGGTVRIHLENIYQRLHVSSRAAAVTRAFAGRVAHQHRFAARSACPESSRTSQPGQPNSPQAQWHLNRR
jgi:DNA-binding CsgD family transcriptional regulator